MKATIIINYDVTSKKKTKHIIVAIYIHIYIITLYYMDDVTTLK